MAYNFYRISFLDPATSDASDAVGGSDISEAFKEALKLFSDVIAFEIHIKTDILYLLAYNGTGNNLELFVNNIRRFFESKSISDEYRFSANRVDADAFIDELGAVFMRATQEKRAYISEQAQQLSVEDEVLKSSPRMNKLNFMLRYNVSVSDAEPEEGKEQDSADKAKTEQSQVQLEEQSKNKSRDFLAETFALAGAAEFKSYIEELDATMPVLRELQSSRQPLTQHLLFSVDSGSGCTTMLTLLRDFLAEHRLFGGEKPGRNGYSLRELHFRYLDGANSNLENALEEAKKAIRAAAPGVVGIHIAEWIKLMDHNVFSRLLDFCWDQRKNTVFVFILPFVEENVLSRVHTRLGDVLNMRIIRIPQYTDEELTGVAQQTVFEYGIKWDDSANDYFRRALVSERSDQHFYGMRTVKKLSTEIVLMKARNIALKRNECPKDVLMGEDFIGTIADEPYSGEISGFEMLDGLIGLDGIKRRIREIVASIKVQKKLYENGGDIAPCYHMMFTGNPGTGKTIVARIVGKIFRENGLLPRGDLIEVSRWDMVGEYIGQTGPKTVALCHSARGSVLFIDEAYLFCAGDGISTRDFGREALGALIAEMENNRSQIVVIMAGYKEEMENLLKLNAGLRDRMPHHLHFESYSREELLEIFKLQLHEGYDWDEGFMQKASEFFMGLSDALMKSQQFGNGRFVRNIVERIRTKAMMRIVGEPALENGKLILLATDLESALADSDIGGLNEKSRSARVGFMV